MKKLLLLLLSVPLIGFSQQRVSIEHLTDSSGRMYGDPSVEGVKYGGELFTGIAYIEIYDNRLVAEYNYENGVCHGFKIWYDRGELKAEWNCIDGNVNEWTTKEWHENGQPKAEGIFKDGVKIKISCWDLTGESIDCFQEEEEEEETEEVIE